jgi:malonate-semialdehyde dehydrogenase (acetylating)/methylmalonate-semialdehyde dehydrogenase
MMRDIGHFVGGKEVKGGSGRTGDVFNPNTGEVQAKVAFASKSEVEAPSPTRRAASRPGPRPTRSGGRRVMFKFLELVQAEYDDLARLLSSEHGKTFVDAKGDIQRGLEVGGIRLRHPASAEGRIQRQRRPGHRSLFAAPAARRRRRHHAVQFPAMIPLWKCAPAIACGNAFILKPSERDPSVPMRIAELFLKAGLPAGILNVVNGDKEAVDTLLTDPRIQAIGFVGSSAIAEYIYATGCAHGKRVQCFGGAKNHMIVMPDADMDQAVDALVGAGYGSAGERCMAISVAVPVGQKTADALMKKLVPRVESLKIGPSTDDKADYGPMVTKAHYNKVKDYVDIGVKEGAKLVVDGRNFKLQGYENGNFMGGCLFDEVTPDMRIYKEEIFGPVPLGGARQGLRGGGAAAVRKRIRQRRLDLHPRRRHRARLHQPRPGRYGRSELRDSRAAVVLHIRRMEAFGFGDLNQHGPDSIRFYTKTKTVTARWPSGTKEGAEFVIPTMK